MSIFNIPTDFDAESYIAAVESRVERFNFKSADEFIGRVADLIDADRMGCSGDTMPWADTHDKMRFRPGEVTIWCGYNGHKKSMLTGMVALWLTKKARVCVASLEVSPEQTLLRMLRQAVGKTPSAIQVDDYCKAVGSKLQIYDQVSSITPIQLRGVIYYAANDLNCSHIFVDSLTKCGVRGDDLAGQKEIAESLVADARKLNVHIHLVAHLRKPNASRDGVVVRPTKYDLRGASELSDLAQNVIIVYANSAKRKVEAKQEAGDTLTDAEFEKLSQPDIDLMIEKQRNGHFEGDINFWFDKKSLQFKTSSTAALLRFPV